MKEHDDIPEFMERRPPGRRSFPSLDRSDYLWPEGDTSDFEARFQAADGILLHVLLAIIRGYGGPDRKKRLADAFASLTGQAKPEGNRAVAEDAAILLAMGDLYTARRLGFDNGPLDIAAIAREAFEIIEGRPLLEHEADSTIRRLRRKFNGNKDYWCYVASLMYQPETVPLRRALTQAVAALRRLGVPIDERTLNGLVRNHDS